MEKAAPSVHTTSLELSAEERERTKRQKMLEGWDQLTLKQATVFIAGIGALGCEIGKDLALCGIGKLILCDMDKIETSNLSRQMLFYKGDEGRYKAEVAAERLSRMNPFMHVEVYTIPLQKIPISVYQQCQVVVAALDNVQARMDLNKFCLKLGIPLVEGGTVGFEGHVQVIIPENTPTIPILGQITENPRELIDQLIQERLTTLTPNENPQYFHALEEITNLEKKIDNLKEEFITPVVKKIETTIMTSIEKSVTPQSKGTPCYRCVVPIPPPLQNQVAACTLKGIPRTREHCAIKGEVHFMNQYNRSPNLSNKVDLQTTLQYAQKELQNLRDRVLDESIPPELKEQILPMDLLQLKTNIHDTFGEDFALEDMENILEHKIPAIQSVSSIIASIQSQEILKLIFLMQGKSIGPIMNPPYLNYNGIYGLFDPIPINRRSDCVACGTGQGQDNFTVVVPESGTVADLLTAIIQVQPGVNRESWMLTNPLTKRIIYNPLFAQGRDESRKLQELELKHLDELTLTLLGKGKESVEIKQYNVILQLF